MSNWFKRFLVALFGIFKPRMVAINNPQQQTVPNVQDNDEDDFQYTTSSPKDRIYEKDEDRSIPYYPKLVDHLEMDHQQLVSLYTNVGTTLDSSEYQLIPGQLAKFKEDFKAHLETENIRFYGYLEQSLKENNAEFQSLRRFRKEMRTIERTVIKFLEKWIDNGIDKESHTEFYNEYSAIGSALVKRIESEEKELYILYGRV